MGLHGGVTGVSDGHMGAAADMTVPEKDSRLSPTGIMVRLVRLFFFFDVDGHPSLMMFRLARPSLATI